MQYYTDVLLILTVLTLFMTAGSVDAQSLPGFDTNLEKRSINLEELIDGGPVKDGIPSIDNPRFISQDEASGWLNGREPVIALEVRGIYQAGLSPDPWKANSLKP